MRVHVTGATGFIGTNFMDAARSSGHDMVALVRSQVADQDKLTQVEIGDMADVQDWSAALDGADAVVHLAARVHVIRDKAADPVLTYERFNTNPTLRLARASARAGVSRFVFMSSIKVNGERTGDEPFTSSSPAEPVDPYGVSKHRAEVGLRQIAAETGMDVVIMRPTVVYGPGVGGNIRRIALAVARGVPLPFGAIRNRRTMLSVDNLVAGMNAALTVERPPSSAVLLGDLEPVSTRDLVELLAEGLGRRPRLVSVPTSALRLGAGLLHRGQDADRLIEDLHVVPDWDRLAVNPRHLVGPETELPALARWFAAIAKGR